VVLTITHLLEKNLVITYDAEENPFGNCIFIRGWRGKKEQIGDSGYDGGAEGVFGAGDGR